MGEQEAASEDSGRFSLRSGSLRTLTNDKCPGSTHETLTSSEISLEVKDVAQKELKTLTRSFRIFCALQPACLAGDTRSMSTVLRTQQTGAAEPAASSSSSTLSEDTS